MKMTKRLVFVTVCLFAVSSALAWIPKFLSLTKSQREFNNMMRESTFARPSTQRVMKKNFRPNRMSRIFMGRL